ncbi:phage exclusion protein Lit family protein [Bacteroides sp.]|uniref:phage exclusion protein Lit family protein n=1 Tax=Bacteroides sp. TaxID=29523 RepID=UPI00262A785D|nr:phage exclusion protein Lit family protein [Bacteroides sp.]MDD3039478.1 phage exclusion protein Lit family protein [Bacteroides sp.]
MHQINYHQYNDGILPVSTLNNAVIEWLSNVSIELNEMLQSEITYNKFNGVVNFRCRESHIDIENDLPYINTRSTVILSENYNQLLWCISYFICSSFDETLEYMDAKINGKPCNPNTFIIKKSMSVFEAGLSLINEYNKEIFFKLPNPEKYSNDNQLDIEKTNSVYCAGISFIILHEFAHHYYGHITYCPSVDISKKEEFDADDFAIEYLLSKCTTLDSISSQKVGVIAVLISLFFCHKTDISGGDTHPDLDDRLYNYLGKLNDNDDSIYAIVIYMLLIWMKKNNIDYSSMKKCNPSWKEFCISFCDCIKQYKLHNL